MDIYFEILKSVAVGLDVLRLDGDELQSFIYHATGCCRLAFRMPSTLEPTEKIQTEIQTEMIFGIAAFHPNGTVTLRDDLDGVDAVFDLTKESSIPEMKKWFEQYKHKQNDRA